MNKYWIYSLEHRAYWAPDAQGYTTHIEEAGVYTHEQAIQIVTNANYSLGQPPDEAMIPVRPISKTADVYHGKSWKRCPTCLS